MLHFIYSFQFYRSCNKAIETDNEILMGITLKFKAVISLDRLSLGVWSSVVLLVYLDPFEMPNK